MDTKFKLFIALFISTFLQPSLALEVLTDTGLKQVITVAKSGGDFRSPNFALDSIAFANENNQYLILIKPGDYFIGETLNLDKPFVDIVGSGPDNTRLIMASADLQATAINVIGAQSVRDIHHNRLANFTLENRRRSNSTVGIAAHDDVNLEIDNVKVEVTGGSSRNTGIYFDSLGYGVVNISDSFFRTQTFGTSSDVGIEMAFSSGFSLIFNDVISVSGGIPLNNDPSSSAYGLKKGETTNNLVCNHCILSGRSGSILMQGGSNLITLNHGFINSGIEIGDPLLNIFPGPGTPTLRCHSIRQNGELLTEDCQLQPLP